MSLREHLEKFHEVYEAHQKGQAAHFAGLKKCFQKGDFPAEKAATVESSHSHLQGLEDGANATAAYHKAAREEVHKSTDAEFEKRWNELVPTQVSSVTPTRPGIVAVPRAGAQPIEVRVAPNHEKFVKTEDEEERSLLG